MSHIPQMKLPTPVEFFDSIADNYESSTGGCTLAITRSLLELPCLQGVCSSESHVLDNAAGTGVVAGEIIRQARNLHADIPNIHIVDPAGKMISAANAKISRLDAAGRCKAAVMYGENLDFADNTFSHSITNMGILFFKDPSAGAKEIYRTLRPGGVAVVTSWAELGYLTKVIHPAQKAVRPTDPLFQLPVPPVWFQPDHVKSCLEKDGGFSDVEVLELQCHYGAPTLLTLQQMLLRIFGPVFDRWPSEDQEKFTNSIAEILPDVAEEYIMPNSERGLGVPMRAIVAICKK